MKLYELPAGRLLDEAVAEHVMGWRRGNRGAGDAYAWYEPISCSGACKELPEQNVPRYSGRIDLAWPIFERFAFDEYWRLETNYKEPYAIMAQWLITVDGETAAIATGASAPEVICRAVLRLTLNPRK